MELDWEPSVRCCQKESTPCDARELCYKASLIVSATDVLEHGARVDHVETAICERKATAVGLPVNQPGIPLLEERSVVDTDCRDFVLVGVPSFDVIRAVIALIGRNAYVEQGLDGLYGRIREEDGIHSTPCLRGDPDRQRGRPRDVVLSVRLVRCRH